jgi:ubiquinone/menaquinone biosynthesis C-methylase UbiE
LNKIKADFFDSEVDSDWSAREYGVGELGKIDRILDAGAVCPGAKVIEPGCGTGRLTRIIADTIGPRGVVLASDISAKMVEKARRRLEGYLNVQLICGTIEDAPLDPGPFDAVICHNVFPHFDDKHKVVTKLRSALKPSGLFVVSHLMSSSEINDLHRKTNPAVAQDFLPTLDEMRNIFESVKMIVELLYDDENGYLLRAVSKNPSRI